MSSKLTPLQEVYIAEHDRWCDIACDINCAMMKNGKPKDLNLGVSIIDYALERLLKEVSSAKSKDANLSGVKYNGLPKATYYRRLKEWTLELYDKDGNPYYVSPKHCMAKSTTNKDKGNG